MSRYTRQVGTLEAMATTGAYLVLALPLLGVVWFALIIAVAVLKDVLK